MTSFALAADQFARVLVARHMPPHAVPLVLPVSPFARRVYAMLGAGEDPSRQWLEHAVAQLRRVDMEEQPDGGPAEFERLARQILTHRLDRICHPVAIRCDGAEVTAHPLQEWMQAGYLRRREPLRYDGI